MEIIKSKIIRDRYHRSLRFLQHEIYRCDRLDHTGGTSDYSLPRLLQYPPHQERYVRFEAAAEMQHPWLRAP